MIRQLVNYEAKHFDLLLRFEHIKATKAARRACSIFVPGKTQWALLTRK